MGQYQYALRNELAAYRQELEKSTSPDLGIMMARSQTLLDKFLAQPDESWEARGNFFFTLYRINKKYYQQHIVDSRSAKTKFLNFFGGRPSDEKDFLKWQKNLKEMSNRALATKNDSWREDFIVTMVSDQFKIRKGNPKDYLHGINDAENQSMRLRLYSHRLMRDKQFRGDEYKHFHGLAFELSAYKLVRDIEKFYGQYSAKLSPQQKSNLAECMHAIDGFLEIQEWLIFSKHLSANNPLEKGIEFNQTYQRRYQDICYRIHYKLHQLQPGERLLVPHGYSIQNEDGHAALVEFERMKNGAYNISFVNTGSGVSGQKRGFWSDLKLNLLGILNVTYVENISFETLLQKELVKKILDPFVYPKTDDAAAIAAMNDAINCFADELKQTDHAINLQMNGTCSFSCWIEWLGWRLDQGLFRSLDLFINERALEKLQRFYANHRVPLYLKNGIPDLNEAGKKLVANNRRDLLDWLDQNRENENWSTLRVIAKTMGVEVKDFPETFASRMRAHDLEVMRALDDSFGVDDHVAPVTVNQQISSLGMFGRAAVGVAVTAAAVALYSRLM